MSVVQETDKKIEIWRLKQRIKTLEAARGNGTSLISLIIPPGDDISRVATMFKEFPNPSHIWNRVSPQSVLGAINVALPILEHYIRVPPSNGLVLYTGTKVTDDGNEEMVTVQFEPFKPINTLLCLCENKFHTEALNELLESDDTYGFIVVDGNGTLFGKLSGITSEILHKFPVDLGGQSPPQLAHIQMEERCSYLRKIAELAAQFFINPATSQANVFGLILATSADFKTELSETNMFDPRLEAKIFHVVDVSYGLETGFSQAIELSSEIRANMNLILEICLLEDFTSGVRQHPRKCVIGFIETLKALEMGAVKVLIVWEKLEIYRYVLKNRTTGETIVKHLNKDKSSFWDSESISAELQVEEQILLVEWLVDEYKKFGCTLEIVTDKSLEGRHFCLSLLGIGGMLRDPLDVTILEGF